MRVSDILTLGRFDPYRSDMDSYRTVTWDCYHIVTCFKIDTRYRTVTFFDQGIFHAIYHIIPKKIGLSRKKFFISLAWFLCY